jgi:prepilin peptidase dependent protein B
MKLRNIRTLKSKQAGLSLMEVLISMSISLIVTASMVALMANSLASTTRIIKMTKLTDDLRTAMVMMSRDVRRSSYSANAMFCFANPNCRQNGTVSLPGDITFSDNNDCFIYQMDRDQDGDATENAAGGFRRVVTGSVGRIEMWTGGSAAACDSNSTDWVSITDSNNLDITSFQVDDNQSYTEVILDDAEGNQTSHKVRKIRMNIQGRLIVDNSITRTIEDLVQVRNHIVL